MALQAQRAYQRASSATYATAVSLSTDDSRGSSSRSFTSYGSSHSTIWGPGAVAGKGIKALGESTLRGIETMIIYRRLLAIEAFFPSGYGKYGKETGNVHERMERMHADALELSRLDMYSDRIRARAMRAIVKQVVYGGTQVYLWEALYRWPHVEIKLFIFAFLSFPFQENSPEPIYARLFKSSDGDAEQQILMFLCYLRLGDEAINDYLDELGLSNMRLLALESLSCTPGRHDWLKEAYDVMELARPDVNQHGTRERALCIIVSMTCTGDRSFVLHEILKLSQDEMESLLAALLASPFRHHPEDGDGSMSDWKSRNNTSGTDRALKECILDGSPDAFTVVAFISDLLISCPALLGFFIRLGWLDMFLPSVVAPCRDISLSLHKLNSILQSLLTTAEGTQLLKDHCLVALWPTLAPLCIREGDIRFKGSRPHWDRQKAWRDVRLPVIRKRLGLLEQTSPIQDVLPSDRDVDLCVDLLEFIGYHHDRPHSAHYWDVINPMIGEEALKCLQKRVSESASFRAAYRICHESAVEGRTLRGFPPILATIHTEVVSGCLPDWFDRCDDCEELAEECSCECRTLAM